ncbi:hypothetical protein BKA83DRAFT_4335957 [Pisolithus microcarpus]|nr:hypothetical protein BKA83DRAFT_4335957 [Pisolithus microcarpus]
MLSHTQTILLVYWSRSRRKNAPQWRRSLLPSASLSSVDMVDLQKHPLTACLVHRAFKLCSLVVSTLVSTSHAYDVLFLASPRSSHCSPLESHPW